MSRGYQNSRSTGIVLMVGIFVLLLQGCFKQPLIKVEVSANAITKGCEKPTGNGKKEESEGCPKVTVTTPITLTNALGQSVTCNPGGTSSFCSSEGNTAPCPRNSGKKCTTVDIGSHVCDCLCKP